MKQSVIVIEYPSSEKSMLLTHHGDLNLADPLPYRLQLATPKSAGIIARETTRID